MEKEGVSDKVISNVLGRSAAALKANQEIKVSGSASNSSNLINLHWNAMEDVPAGSVWEASKNAPDSERSDFAELVKLFQKKKPSNKQNDRQKGNESNISGKAKLLDHTRATNISISLKAFKEFSHLELAEIIAFLDPLRKIRGERAQFIRDLLPTVTEMKIIDDYTGTDDRLVPAEIWFRHLRGIKRLETKAQVMRTMEMFLSEMAAVQSNYKLLGEVCHQVMSSSKLQEVLAMVLRIGNVMNEGTRTGGAAGFKFDSLLRLTQTKTADGKITVLDYLVKIFVERGQRDSLDLLSDFPECQVASRMLISDMNEEVMNLRKSLNQCRNELNDLRKDYAKPSETAPSEDTRSQLFASIRARKQQLTPNSESRPSQQGFAQRDLFLAAIKEKSCEKKIPEKNVSKKSLGDLDNSLASGVKRLNDFINEVEPAFSTLESHRDEALEACKSLSKYCGESGGTSSTIPLLDILAQFASNLQEALKKYDAQEKSVTKKHKHVETKVNQPDNTKEPGHQPLKDGRSIVHLVNDVLKNANPRFKEDFKKGRCLENPSERLKAIYEREKVCFSVYSVLDSQVPADKAKDIVSAITARGGNDDDELMMQDARSRFAGGKCEQTHSIEISEGNSMSVKDRASQFEIVPSKLACLQKEPPIPKKKTDADENHRMQHVSDNHDRIEIPKENDSRSRRAVDQLSDSHESKSSPRGNDQPDSAPQLQEMKHSEEKADLAGDLTSSCVKKVEDSVIPSSNEDSSTNRIHKEVVPSSLSPDILASEIPADDRSEPVRNVLKGISSTATENDVTVVLDKEQIGATNIEHKSLPSNEIEEFLVQEVQESIDVSNTAHISADQGHQIDAQRQEFSQLGQKISSKEFCLQSLDANPKRSDTVHAIIVSPNQASSSEKMQCSLPSRRSDSYTEVLRTLEEMKRAVKLHDTKLSLPLEPSFGEPSPKTESDAKKRLSLSERARLKRLEKIIDPSTTKKEVLSTTTRLSTGSANMSPLSKDKMSLSELARLKRQKRLSS
jgi:hypothetical protein